MVQRRGLSHDFVGFCHPTACYLTLFWVIFSADVLHSRATEMRLRTPFHTRCCYGRLYITDSLVLPRRKRSSLTHSQSSPQSSTASPQCSSTCKPCSPHSSASWPWLLPTLSWSTEERAMRTIVPGMVGPCMPFFVLTVLRAVTGSKAGQPLATRQADCSAFLNPVPTPTVPNYASACGNNARYSSACSCLGYTAPTYTCISPAQASSIVSTFASFLTAPQAPDFSSKANALLAPNFTDTSGSINFLAGKNVRPESQLLSKRETC